MTEHHYRNAIEIEKKGKIPSFFVVECKCGWSSKLHLTAQDAREAYAKHKESATTDLSAREGKGS